MRDLQRLVRVITDLKQRQYPLLELKGVNENSSKENVFFRYVKKGIVNSDDEAAELLYNTKSDDDRYRMLKSRLKQKLLNHLYFLDLSSKGFPAYVTAKQETLQLLHHANIARFTGEIKIAKNLLNKAHTQAERSEFTRERITALEELYQVYSINCQPHLFDQTIEELESCRTLYKKEEEANVLFYQFKMLLVKSVNSRKKNIDEVIGVIEKIKKLWEETGSINIFINFFSMKLFYMEMIGQFEEIIPFLKEILSGKYEGAELNESRIDKVELVCALQLAYLRTKRFEEATKFLHEQKDIVDPTDKSWFDFKSLHFLMGMHSRNYKFAFDTISEVFENKKFMNLSKSKEEQWKLYNAYLHFAYSGNFFMRSFNFSKFVEDIPEYNKRKEGYNVAILILQFMYFVERGELDELKQRRDEIKKYMDNHFKENFSYRSRTFFKLLNIAVDNNLEVKKIQQKSKYLFNKLQENQIVGESYQEMEIVPYEHLWELMINMIRFEKIGQF